ncbi:MAG TPA: DEAD/DEAH box helicase [Polyangiales bacterium]|nr:DEAD/DEAH box helicase [Polyangiales bacterium]
MPAAAERELKKALSLLSPATRAWFEASFAGETDAQKKAWPLIVEGKSTLLVAPTGSGKTLAAFLVAIDRLLFGEEPEKSERCRVLYVSPLKALVVDIERNLRAPLVGIERTADRLDIPHRSLEVAMRTGDTPSEERARFLRKPADILITTPESLFLMLTGQARETLRSVDTVIIDEIHAMAATKRGSHLMLSLERLQSLREGPIQRIGLSATQRPLEEVARLLGGFEAGKPRPVEIADARAERPIELSIEVPVEDMGALRSAVRRQEDDNGDEEKSKSIWTSIHPRLVELVRAHRSTMVFVNNRRLAERLAAAINETAGEPLARAHHGSVAREQREEIEDALKSGTLPCIVATSSLELGLDIGAVELVVQIEAPPSVSSGIQRIGRANHRVGGNPKGTIFPKHRGDLVASAEAVRRMLSGEIEYTRYPRNPLDVLAQQMVAIVASEESIDVDKLFELCRQAAPFAELTRGAYDSVLDMLSGRYPSDEFAELRPRITFHREERILEPRKGSKRLAIANAGVIPDRGLYGVFLADGGNEKTSRRVGELDEEMVYEAREGEVFVLGASSWRINEITHDRVLVTPAPGEPGKLPFWRGDGLGRSVELGRGIGALLRRVERSKDAEALKWLQKDHVLEERAARNLLRYVREQQEPPYLVPSEQRMVVERFTDEVGDLRVCMLSPFGQRVHAPLAMCMAEKSKRDFGAVTETVWTDDGIVLRFPESDEPLDVAALFPTPEEIEELLLHALGDTALFASHFRECAGRALLLPRNRPGKRAPLWAQRKRSADLLAVASRYGSFPILLETYRECLQDVFDVPALTELMGQVQQHKVELVTVDADKPSPFSSNLLFSYIGNFIYDSDAPLAERRAQALSIDHTQLRELLGQAELRDLLDPDAVHDVAQSVGRFLYPPKHPDELHDLLLFVGDLSEDELKLRGALEQLAPLLSARRVILVKIAGEPRYIAAEDAGRYRDALGVNPPQGVASAFLESVAQPLLDLVSRYARTHVPFAIEECAGRYGLRPKQIEQTLDELVTRGRLVRGELHPDKAGITYCDNDVLRAIKRRSLAALRKQVEAVDQQTYARFLLRWHGIGRPARGENALRAALERLEGAKLPFAALTRDILPARVKGFEPGDLDLLLATGELVWRGIEAQLGGGRIALYFRDRFELLAPAKTEVEGPLAAKIRAVLAQRGAVFFFELAKTVEAFPPDVLEALWSMVWAGEVTNDTLAPLRSRASGGEPDRKRGVRVSRTLPGSEGRWTLLQYASTTPTEQRMSLVSSLLARHGVLVREALKAEDITGGFSAIYEVLRAMEDTGRLRRGYFVEGLGATQFAHGGAEELLRSEREPSSQPELARILASTDPASPWGAALAWPAKEGARPMRADGANVVLLEGRVLAWLGRKERTVLTYFQDDKREAEQDATMVAEALSRSLSQRERLAYLIAAVDGEDVTKSALGKALLAAGFQSTSRGYLKRAPRRRDEVETEEAVEEDLD